MQKKYAADGLVCMSANVDDADDRDKALKFLKSQDAKIQNFLINEPGEVWQTILDVSGPPSVVVYGRDGQVAKRFTNPEPFDYGDVEKFVASLLKAQP
jgi:hypothetical protein